MIDKILNTASNTLFKISKISRSIGKNLSKEKRDRNALLQNWNKLNKGKKFRTNYNNLNNRSVVFDLGGYEGQWASDIFAQYLCEIHVFEPHPVFYKEIKERFKNNEKIKSYQFGLASKEERVNFVTDADSTSMFGGGGKGVEVQLKEAKRFLEVGGFTEIALMKINIEGGEYDLLEHLLESGWIKKIKNLQIQFHHFVPEAEKRMLLIQKKLKKTHSTTYQYRFFWENWSLNES